MRPAALPVEPRDAVKLMQVGRVGQSVSHHDFTELPGLLEPGDLLVLNDSATLPASLPASLGPGAGEALDFELRLAQPPFFGSVWAVAMGSGSWRVDTNRRGAPPALGVGQALTVAGLPARVVEVSELAPRLVRVHPLAPGDAVWAAIYRHGRPVQYSHLGEGLALWSVQTSFAGRPWSVEMPSAGRPLSWSTLVALRRRGVEIATLTHAAGLSATGDLHLDAALPLPERSDIPAATVEAVARARGRQGRVIAMGTTVVRALEGRVALRGTLQPGDAVTDLRLSPTTPLRVADAIVTGMHTPGESHFELLGAFVDAEQLDGMWKAALEAEYRSHEFGDLALLWRRGLRSAGE